MKNLVILMGHVGSEPLLVKNKLTGESSCFKFSLATNESYKDNEGNKVDKTEWHEVIIFGRSVTRASEMVKKGSKIYLHGSIQSNDYEDKEGRKISRKQIVVKEWNLL